jgi:hypothetical protein
LVGGQSQAGQQAAAVARQQFEPTVVGAGDAVDDGQPQAGAGRIGAGGFEPGEGALHALDLIGRDAGSAIEDLDVEFA